MSNFNKVFLMGNLTRDPELKFTPQGTAICKFGIAVNNVYKGADGEMKKDTDFFNITVMGKMAENCGKYLSKGRPVFVEAKLKPRSWEDKETKQKRFSLEIIAQSVQFLGSGQSDSQRSGGGEQRQSNTQDEQGQSGFDPNDEVPF